MNLIRMLLPIVLAAGLAACDKIPGLKGEPGPPGPPGPAGQAGSAAATPSSSVRIVRANCNATTCAAKCEQGEDLFIAYCGAGRNPAVYLTDGSATCRARMISPR